MSTRPTEALAPPGRIDELGDARGVSGHWNLGRPAVHVIDRAADAVTHYRRGAGHAVVVRAGPDRVVRFEGREAPLAARVREPGPGWARVTDARAEGATVRVGGGKRVRTPGPPLGLRLIVSWALGPDGAILAEWFLLASATPRFVAPVVAQWYAWRWRIEGYRKLLKAAGMNAEPWRQQTGAAVARRLAVARTACPSVWCRQQDTSAEASAVRAVLVRLSGRQMRRGVEHTAPAVLAGRDKRLAVPDGRRTHDLGDLFAQAQRVQPNSFSSA